MKMLLTLHFGFLLTKSTTLLIPPGPPQGVKVPATVEVQNLFDLNKPAAGEHHFFDLNDPAVSEHEFLDLNESTRDEPSLATISAATCAVNHHPVRVMNPQYSEEEPAPWLSPQERFATVINTQPTDPKHTGNNLLWNKVQNQSSIHQGLPTSQPTSHDFGSSTTCQNDLNDARKPQKDKQKIDDSSCMARYEIPMSQERENRTPPKSLNVIVDNWEYVKASSPPKYGLGKNIHQRKALTGFHQSKLLLSLLNDLNQLTHAKLDGFKFCITRENAPDILHVYLGWKLPYPGGISRGTRRGALWKIALSVSNEILGMGTRHTFTHEIIGPLRQKLTKYVINSITDDHPEINLTQAQLGSALQYVTNITKVVPFLIITHHTLFNEHKSQRLDDNLVENILAFVKRFWEDTQNATSELRQNHSWSRINAVILKSEDITRSHREYRSSMSGITWYNMAWKIAFLWLKENNQNLEAGSEQETYDSIVMELINRIIFYANYRDPQSFMQDWGGSYTLEIEKS
ncbi:hypothetical protein PGT21_024842 [Puccinia graminis f. sp. tritici]|uniref:Golgi to ER traffic-protein n=2 Tax=Puccinia graminis f. sp. tritici TaxID=56615 RepID=E3KNR5_PUCGT|nr:uncharacterized protein PGTG_11696 [Puccinia graminis f. sp. tritici CRL 75-36-700-3]EFP85940.2 hypothetical protein PGTG_11696 [Puccinia graminis f. sp. tritici CRL 75-36-700-3]KAA1073764.1 hypothetical protein PGT21_024842 [Puccinia graminis f. sp. tritici]